MDISKIMQKEIVSVGLDNLIKEVKEIFEQSEFHHLLVIDEGHLFGIISDRDLFKALSPNIGTYFENDNDLATLNKKVHHIVTRKPITISESGTLAEAVDIFNNNKISCIPVVNDKNEAVGIVTWRDILRLLATLNGPKE